MTTVVSILAKPPQDDWSLAVGDWGASPLEKGEVFTKPEVVNFMVSLLDIRQAGSIEKIRVLEPSCGHGEFLLPIVAEILKSASEKEETLDISVLMECVVAFDIVKANVDIAKSRLSVLLETHGFSSEDICALTDRWVIHGDFLQAKTTGLFTHIIGNPPYVRVENIPKVLLDAYRKAFATMADRADLYIPFFEKSLSLLNENGKLCFICTDRWTKNQYGRKLRGFISNNFSFDLYIDLYGAEAFQKKVLTYPAITLMGRKQSNRTLICHNPSLNQELMGSIKAALASHADAHDPKLQYRKDVVNGEHPWLLGSAEQIELVRKLEEKFPTLQEAHCNVFIGAATGNNEVFIIDESVEIEEDRKLPVVTASEIRDGKINWNGKYIINTYGRDGVAPINEFPMLSAYLHKYEDDLRKRHVAKNSPATWYKTIDRVYPNRARSPKLMIPDIKSELTVVFDVGLYHPNNSIYYICSDIWDLQALKAVLISGVGNLFVQTYTTKVGSGFMRFQAQHLRRIRIPEWDSVPQAMKALLIDAGKNENKRLCADLVADLYELTLEERDLISDY